MSFILDKTLHELKLVLGDALQNMTYQSGRHLVRLIDVYG